MDNALEMPFAERVRAATVPAKYASKFGSSESTVAPHVLMRGGVESFDHFMRLEVGDMAPAVAAASASVAPATPPAAPSAPPIDAVGRGED